MRSHDNGKLQEYFAQKYRRPRLASILGLADTTVDVGIELAEALDLGEATEVGIVKRGYRRLTLGARIRIAAWKLLRPNPPVWGDLRQLAKSAGADHLNLAQFCSRLGEQCQEIARSHPELKRWIYRRMALLDWVLVRRKRDRSRRDEAFQLRNALDACLFLSQINPQEAIDQSSQLCEAALGGAANAVVDAIADATGLSANLMLPIERHCLPRWTSEPALSNQRRADELWANVGDHNARLVVLAESDRASHIGFWVPVIPKRPGTRLPGATEAIAGNASLVIKDDLPYLEGFSQAMQQDWERYMTRDFHNDLFLSLPVRLPKRQTPVGVLNVNVNVGEEAERQWYRAYSQAWTTQAEDYSAEFTDLALRALAIAYRRVPGLSSLDCGVPTPAPAMLTAGNETESEEP